MMDRTSPEHADLVAQAVEARRDGNLAALDALRRYLRRLDGLRFTEEQADPDQWWVIDRWDDGWIIETWPTGRAAEIRANQLNARNIREGQADLRERTSGERSA